ncbi:hypothetical protein BTA51_21315 [Hahella sp. CCB-MM4]|uniref:pilus assembly protein n=1 Tax=Hahella sp. (strain CCB-MM4) TaxID=1926491 RepID=UPI000B9B00B1|nr:PilC/PilY family type IV pilus protein [Hahella sp. CCB-MM4]OZG71477.1 hypothetical protein BTA51_21315 [Hahella sp. CCB-MM4]
MKKYASKFAWALLGGGLVLPTTGYTASALGNFPDSPLFLDESAEPNIIVGFDDSGSMDWETITSMVDGLFWVGSDGKFSTNGNFYDSDVGVEDFGYLFPNGTTNGSYYGNKGQQLYSSRKNIPPFRAYAFARSSSYNNAFYNPSTDYEPWTIFGGATVTSPVSGVGSYTSFSDASTTNTLFDPMLDSTASGTTLTLFQEITPSNSFYGTTNMWCDDDATQCTADGSITTTDTKYVPGTYYIVDSSDTSTYEYSLTHSGFTDFNSELYEAEDSLNALISGTDFKKGSVLNSDDNLSTADYVNLAKDASGKDFVGTDNLTASTTGAVPSDSTGEIKVDISLSGDVSIWVRRWFWDGSHDSVYMSIDGKDSGDITAIGNTGNWLDDGTGQMWNYWRDNHTLSSSWVWEKWADVTLDGSETLRIRYRENLAFVDQILITTASSTPSGQLTLTSATTETRNCSTDPVASHYDQFFEYPNDFSGVDAIAPDGKCLKKIELTSSNYADADVLPSGRTYLEEKQNFANWFSFHRRRHQIARAALAKSFEGFSGIRVGFVEFSDTKNTSSDLSMYDLDVTADATTFQQKIYNAVDANGTPLRRTLDFIGEQYKRTDGSAPIDAACQKNFALVFSDGFNTRTVDYDTDTSSIANDDGDNDSDYDDQSYTDSDSVTHTLPYQDTYSQTLADVAMYYYENNLRTDKTSGQVNVNAKCDTADEKPYHDCNPNLHMNTYMVGLGVIGTIFDEVNYDEVTDAYTTTPTWPDVSGLSSPGSEQVDDMYHAAVNGRGEMYTASDSAELSSKLSSAVTSIVGQIGSGSGVTFNTSSILSESVIFSTIFNSTSWYGDLIATKLNENTGITENEAWRASDHLTSSTKSAAPTRYIFTYNPTATDISGGGTGRAKTFAWDNLTDTQKTDLLEGVAPGSATSDQETSAKNRLDYLRGDTTKDGTDFRDRYVEDEDSTNDGYRLLGDIINSTPVYVGAPSQNYPDSDPFGAVGKRYSSFYSSYSSRTPVVYVGANDGMLHGFNGNTGDSDTDKGKEVMAYIPNLVYSSLTSGGLSYLTDPDYAHKHYVDLTPVAADVYIDADGDGTKEWRTILVGGMRTGGKGLFALDITDPTKYSSSTDSDIGKLALWEFTGDDDLGYMVSPPIVAMVKTGNQSTDYKWAVIFGNGYNSVNNSTKLYIVYIEGGVDGTWTEGTDYIEIDTQGTGGLSGVAVADMDGDRVADRAYAGDLDGNMWAFDLDETTGSVVYGTNPSPKPLFTAAGNQPITSPPNLSKHPSESGSDPNALVAFGTGQYLIDGDETVTDDQTFYVIWDKGTGELDRTYLAPRYLTQGTITIDSTTYDSRTISGTEDPWTSKYGWYLDLVAKDSSDNPVSAEDGERIIYKPLIRNDFAVISTTVPNNVGCEGGGHSWLMILGLDNGTTGDPVFDVNNDGVVDAGDTDGQGNTTSALRSDALLNETGIMGDFIMGTNSDGGLEQQRGDFGSGSDREGRLGWREIFEN